MEQSVVITKKAWQWKDHIRPAHLLFDEVHHKWSQIDTAVGPCAELIINIYQYTSGNLNFRFQQKDPWLHQQHNCKKTQLPPMEKHESRNRLVQIYRKQTTLQLHLFPHRKVLWSISQDLLMKALDFPSDNDNITTDKRNIIIHAKNSILIHNHLPYKRKVTQCST